MRLNLRHFQTIALLSLAFLMMFSPAVAQSGASEKVLFSFPANGPLGNTPNGKLISDAGGNLYGVNLYGGVGSGAVFELSPTADGGWTAKSIYVFPKNVFFPGGLVMDSSGNLYGTEYSGGTGFCTDGYENYFCGAVFELSPNASGGWSQQIIWNSSQTGGWGPTSLTLDAAGNLYGTTIHSDYYYGGTVFELQRSGDTWKETVLRAFGQQGSVGGAEPQGPLLFDSEGNIYGATFLGGALGGGTVFELKKNSGWEQTNLFEFNSSNSDNTGGYGPGGVLFDSAGNLYGVTSGNSGAIGVVAFEVSPTSGGSWQETVLHSFVWGAPDGWGPSAPTFDAAGNLYGSTCYGGAEEYYGLVFQLEQSADGTWSEVKLHSFPDGANDGKCPDGLLPGPNGILYGTTSGGGTAGVGTVFEITP